LYEYAVYAKSLNSNLSINDVIDGKSNFAFKPLISENQNVGFSSKDFWLKFKLENTTNQTNTYYLQTARPVTDVLFAGSITIESDKGYGTEVSIRLDFNITEQKNTIIETDNLAKNESSSIKVLIVEDNIMNQMIMRKMLNRLTITDFKLAGNGKEILKLL